MNPDETSSLPSRRAFLKGMGATAVATAATQAKSIAEQVRKMDREAPVGPEPTPIVLHINGKAHELEVEPRETLLDVMRNRLNLTGPKEVCDRATCGACSVLINGEPRYACMILAIATQGQRIVTIEGISPDGERTDLQRAFIYNDGLMCGFCTPGFVTSLTALLERNPSPTEEEVRRACAGNLCRCGAYPRVFDAALKAAGVEKSSSAEVISYRASHRA